MTNLKKRNNIFKMLLGLLVTSLILVGCGVGAESEVKFSRITVEYGQTLDTDEFSVRRDREEIMVTIEDIDTMKFGDTKYPVETEFGKEKVTVRVVDTQYPVIVGEDEFEITLGETINLEDYLSATDPVDGDLEISYNLPEINDPGTYVVIVSARDSNDNKKDKKVILTVLPK